MDLPHRSLRVGVIAQWYPPEPDIRIRTLAQGLAGRGHSVTVVTGFPNYPDGALYPGYRLRWRQWEADGPVRVLRVPLYPDHSPSVIRRAANYLSFAGAAAILAPPLIGPLDVVWAYQPPLTVAVPAIAVSALRGAPYIIEVQDLWPDTLIASGMTSEGILTRVIDRAARVVYRLATAVSVISPGFEQRLLQRGVPAAKVHVIPNWADTAHYAPRPTDAGLASEIGLDSTFTVVYGGNLGPAQGLANVLRAAAMLAPEDGIHFVFVGTGVEHDMLVEMAGALHLRNVTFLGRKAPEEMSRYLSLGDVLLVHLRRDPLFEVTIPSKTLTYLAMGRPILGVVTGDPADVIRDAGAGLTCAQDDPAALVDAVRRLRDMTAAQRAAMGALARQAFDKHYSAPALIDRYEVLFNQVARARR